MEYVLFFVIAGLGGIVTVQASRNKTLRRENKRVVDFYKSLIEERSNMIAELACRIQDRANTISELIAENKRTWDFLELMTDKLWEATNRPPILIPPPTQPDIVAAMRTIMDGMAITINGWRESQQQVQQEPSISMGDLHPSLSRARWLPEVEFDTLMNGDEVWTPDGVVATTPSPLTMDQTPQHTMVQGRIVRTDGQETFRAGTSAPPPVGGIE